MFFSQTKRMIQSWWLRYYVIQANDHHWLLLLQNFAMGNSNSTPEPAPGTEKRRSSLFHTTEDDLGRLARIKKAEDARKEAIAANTHDNIKVGWWDRYSEEVVARTQFECRLWSWEQWHHFNAIMVWPTRSNCTGTWLAIILYDNHNSFCLITCRKTSSCWRNFSKG